MTNHFRSAVRWALWGDSHDRVRAVWRISLPLCVGVVAFVIAYAAGSMLPLSEGRTQVLPFVVTPIIVYGTVRVTSRSIDKRPFRSYGFTLSRTWLRDAVAGGILGALVIALTIAVAFLLGSISPAETELSVRETSVLWLGIYLVGFLGVAFWEELVFRAIVIVNGVEAFASRGCSPRLAVLGALVGSIAVYVIVHLPGGVAEGHSPWLIAMWTASLGLLTGVAYLLTREVAMPMGIHLSINVIPINILGISPTAAMDGVPTLVSIESAATGFTAPMVGLPVTVSNIIGCGLLLGWWRWRRGELTPAIHRNRQLTRVTDTGHDDD